MTIDDAVAEVVFSRPERANALSDESADALVSIIRSLSDDRDVRAVLFHGRGRGFCAGGDLKQIADVTEGVDDDDTDDGARRWADLLLAVAEVPQATIAAVHGYAMGIGCGIAASCDVVLASDDAELALPEIHAGLFPAVVFPVVASAIGLGRARELALTGRRITASEAVAIGLAHRLVRRADLVEASRDVARRLAALDPVAVRNGKRLILDVRDLPLVDAIAVGQSRRTSFPGLGQRK